MGSDKEHNTIIYYCNGRFGTDTKMIQKVCEEIVNLYKYIINQKPLLL